MNLLVRTSAAGAGSGHAAAKASFRQLEALRGTRGCFWLTRAEPATASGAPHQHGALGSFAIASFSNSHGHQAAEWKRKAQTVRQRPRRMKDK